MPRAVSNDWYAGYVLSFTQLECMTIWKTNEDHDNTQHRESGTDTAKCALVNEKLDAEVISMCIVAVWVGHKSSEKWQRPM